MLKNYGKLERKLLLTGIVLLFCIVIISWFTPLGFSAYQKGDNLADIWLFITDTIVKTGTITSVVIIGIFIFLFQKSKKKGIRNLLLFVIPFLITLKIFADINHYITKPYFGLYRPSLQQFAKKGMIDIDKLYGYKTTDERETYLSQVISPSDIDIKVNNIHPEILKHWMHTTGFSFPSGHAQNAFILCTILSFVLLNLFNGKRYWFIAFIPLFWGGLVALSRVAIGVHTALDITAGAISGFLIAFALILTGLLQKLFNN